jgi:hypothetical protein
MKGRWVIKMPYEVWRHHRLIESFPEFKSLKKWMLNEEAFKDYWNDILALADEDSFGKKWDSSDLRSIASSTEYCSISFVEESKDEKRKRDKSVTFIIFHFRKLFPKDSLYVSMMHLRDKGMIPEDYTEDDYRENLQQYGLREGKHQ